MTIHPFYFNPFRECTYVVQDGSNVIVIDPGMLTEKEQTRFKEYCDTHRLAFTHILITHTHEDHVCGLEWFQGQFGPIEVNCLPEGWECIPTPGHKEDAVCFYVPKEEVLFSGDTLFQESVGRTDLPGGDTATLMRSLKKLAVLPKQTTVYPGHGYSTTIAHEIEFNPYL